MMPAGAEHSTAEVTGCAAVVVDRNEGGIDGGGAGDVKGRIRVVAHGDDLIQSKRVAVKRVVNIRRNGGSGTIG